MLSGDVAVATITLFYHIQYRFKRLHTFLWCWFLLYCWILPYFRASLHHDINVFITEHTGNTLTTSSCLLCKRKSGKLMCVLKERGKHFSQLCSAINVAISPPDPSSGKFSIMLIWLASSTHPQQLPQACPSQWLATFINKAITEMEGKRKKKSVCFVLLYNDDWSWVLFSVFILVCLWKCLNPDLLTVNICKLYCNI